MNKELKQLKKVIEKHYWEHKQRLYVTTACIFNKKNDYHADILLTDKEGKEYGTFLFEIMTLDCFSDYDYQGGVRSYTKKQNWYNIDIINQASYTPFYMNEVFTLKKFGNITEQDIYNCTNYFIHKILDVFLIFNIKVKMQYREEKKITYPSNKRRKLMKNIFIVEYYGLDEVEDYEIAGALHKTLGKTFSVAKAKKLPPENKLQSKCECEEPEPNRTCEPIICLICSKPIKPHKLPEKIEPQPNQTYSKQDYLLEDFLTDKHADQYIGIKDNMIDDFNDWLTGLDVDEIIKYADEFKKELLSQLQGLIPKDKELIEESPVIESDGQRLSISISDFYLIKVNEQRMARNQALAECRAIFEGGER